MDICKKKLWTKIATYTIGQLDSSFTFTQRLSRENDWNSSFASRVVEEYKKFIYLICISEKMLTPSDEVDQAWHLHLTYTRDYWDDFCKNIVGRSIHHGPTKGGSTEDKKYKECYARTLVLYEVEFGYAPPKDIWPDEEIRFGNAEHLKRIDTSNFFLLPKSHVKATAIFSSVALLTGCTLVGVEVPKEVESLLIIAGLGLVMWWAYRQEKKNKRKDTGCGTGCGGSGCGGRSKGNDSSDNGSDGGSGCGGGGCGGD